MPVEMERLYDALRKADAAGDAASAKRLADYIREQRRSSGGAAAEPAQAEEAPEGSTARGVVYGASELVPFSKQVASAGVAASQLAGDVASGNFPGALDRAVDTYRDTRDEYLRRADVAQEEAPGAFTAGQALGVAGAVATGGVNPVRAVGGLVGGARALLTREGAKAAGRSLLSIEGAKAAASGAAVSGAYALSESDADLTRGEFGEAAQDVAEALPVGAVIGGAARGLLSARSGSTAARTQRAAEGVATAAAAERENALIVSGLEGKQKTLGGAKRAKERAQALYDEPLPSDPSKRLLKEAETLTPDARLELATGLRRETGAKLGAIRDELAKAEVTIPVGPIREQFRGAFAELPTEVQAKALEQVDSMIGALAKDGELAPAALRKLIEDTEGLAKFGTPNLEAALGNARGRVFQSARSVLVQNEREAISRVLPERAPEYAEELRKYGVYSDFELGSKVFLERANKGQALLKTPKSKDSPTVGRRLLSGTAGEVGARVGAMLPIPGSAYAGARAGEALVERWSRWTRPSVATLSAKVRKLERLQPLMEEALRKGPAAVAELHARFMARSPDYRKAVESDE
jgi:hypothetical protein